MVSRFGEPSIIQAVVYTFFIASSECNHILTLPSVHVLEGSLSSGISYSPSSTSFVELLSSSSSRSFGFQVILGSFLLC